MHLYSSQSASVYIDFQFFALQQLLMAQYQNQQKGTFQIDNKKTYLHYTRQMRLKLIKLVDKDKLSTAEAARKVGIKQTSACRIMKSYHKHHRIFQRKEDRQRRQVQNQLEGSQKIPEIQNINNSLQKKIDFKQKNRPQDLGNSQKVASFSVLERNQNKKMNQMNETVLLNSIIAQNFYFWGSGLYPLHLGGSWSWPMMYQ